MVELLRPTYTAGGIEDLPGRSDVLQGVRLVALDVDGVLANYHESPDKQVKRYLKRVG